MAICGPSSGNQAVFGLYPPCAPNRELAQRGLFPVKKTQFVRLTPRCGAQGPFYVLSAKRRLIVTSLFALSTYIGMRSRSWWSRVMAMRVGGCQSPRVLTVE